ncbi:MAG: glycosyltransferase, partial [Acidobacteria bacterium]|nr:glycosyltransferase [Acidobacteriota bacterium]
MERVSQLVGTPLRHLGVHASRDGSWEKIRRLAAGDPIVRGLNLMRNYGQQNALLAGIREAQCEIAITIDDDLQDPPEEIPKLLGKLREGYEVVGVTLQLYDHG